MKIKYQSDQEESRWNHRPKQPVNLNPLFDWPPKFMAIVIWYSGYWLAISTTTLALALAFIAYCTILPPLEVMQIVQVDWIVRVWLANLVPHILCASLLHLWLYEMKGQNKDFKFDPRPLATKNRTFSFSNQVHDNMFWTLASGVTQWSMIQSIVFWAMANGYAPAFLFPDNIIWFFLMFPFLIFWASFHFYWIHRALHWPPLYRIAHAVHHRNIYIGPWSGISMHPIEHLIFYSNFLIHFIVPSHPLHIVFHGYMQSIHPIFPTQVLKSSMLQTKNVQTWVTFSISSITGILNVTTEQLKCHGTDGLVLFMMALKKERKKFESAKKIPILKIPNSQLLH